ncbi:flavo protein-like protein [Blyttiomyces helicus]|uniref:Flavo protein-like protein n=1 Tax=Blyttiomyces helicus TaxID=388810 RepID=A0A4P9WBX5_9FUNG|nr:flavo protein-like protein [Blyttiomyces helicus]|eukprot:RKO88678.1 flavo protein-like protein [Blyttiomyces helicus]
MYAQKFDEIPVLAPEDLVKADGFLFGIPTRFGTPAAQVKTFWDATGKLWGTGALVGKYAGVFTSTGGQHGGMETTIFTFLPHLAHHGIIYVPLGYQAPELHDQSEIIGGSPWGAGAIAGGDGSRKVSEKEIQIALTQGRTFSKTVLKAHQQGWIEASPTYPLTRVVHASLPQARGKSESVMQRLKTVQWDIWIPSQSSDAALQRLQPILQKPSHPSLVCVSEIDGKDQGYLRNASLCQGVREFRDSLSDGSWAERY